MCVIAVLFIIGAPTTMRLPLAESAMRECPLSSPLLRLGLGLGRGPKRDSGTKRRQKTQLQSPSLAMRSSSVGVEEAAYPMTSMREEEEAERKGCGSWALISFFLFCKASSPLVPVDRPVSRLCGRLIDCRAQSSRPHRQSTVDRAHKVQGLAR